MRFESIALLALGACGAIAAPTENLLQARQPIHVDPIPPFGSPAPAKSSAVAPAAPPASAVPSAVPSSAPVAPVIASSSVPAASSAPIAASSGVPAPGSQYNGPPPVSASSFSALPSSAFSNSPAQISSIVIPSSFGTAPTASTWTKHHHKWPGGPGPVVHKTIRTFTRSQTVTALTTVNAPGAASTPVTGLPAASSVPVESSSAPLAVPTLPPTLPASSSPIALPSSAPASVAPVLAPASSAPGPVSSVSPPPSSVPVPVVSSVSPPATTAPAPSASSSPAPAGGSGTVYNGEGTVYTQQGGTGSCGVANPDSAMIVALSDAGFMHNVPNSPYCGKQIKITNVGSNDGVGGKGNTITATVADTCPGCTDPAHVDLSVGVWNSLTANAAYGTIEIQWEFV